jgi:methyl-accepting chemotaxis protein
MIKSLAGKAIIPVAITVTGFVIVCCILLYSVMKVDMTDNAVRQATVLAGTVVKSTRYAMLQSDDENLRDIIANISSQQGVEHVRIFNKKGLIEFSSDQTEIKHNVDKKAAGCIGCHSGPTPASKLGEMQQARQFVNGKGREVIAITAPIYNEPDCFNASCHFHPSGQKVLGTLDIGLSRQPLQQSLTTMRGRMLIFTVMILILTVGGVSALLGRTILEPIRMIKNFCDALSRGDFKQTLPLLEGQMEELASSVRRVATKLEKTEISLQEAEDRLSSSELQGSEPNAAAPPNDQASNRAEDPRTENRHGE